MMPEAGGTTQTRFYTFHNCPDSMDRMKGEYRMKKERQKREFQKDSCGGNCICGDAFHDNHSGKNSICCEWNRKKSITVTNVSDKQLTLKKRKNIYIKDKKLRLPEKRPKKLSIKPVTQKL